MKTKKEYKVGDKVRTFFRKAGSTKKIEIEGVVKEIKKRGQFGNVTYIISSGVVGDFPARNIF